ncbi:DUF885 domain-containing protein [Nakamurella aerolata]|uniref:DUF885 domain-containing protein n=1 Tax=Nakamurella aerolata TaxID=1656892 RepID=A0A849A397_9ACTN|nr:DUF885 domain-containing protein [Nakamurella aerolata]NNG34547.1 DUF885 domain-containing protein [Nakamurella aerolata]
MSAAESAARPTVESATTPRELADGYVYALADHDTMVSSSLGLRPHDDRVPDFSPRAQTDKDELSRQVLAALDRTESGAGELAPTERRCADLLRGRLTADLAMSEAGEHLRLVRNIFGPADRIRTLLLMMPTGTAEDWATIARRMAGTPESLRSYRQALDEGRRRQLFAAPRQVSTMIGQLDDWLAGDRSWFHTFVDGAPADLDATVTAQLAAAADAAAGAVAELRSYLADEYLPAAAGTPDAVGEQRYRVCAATAVGGSVDPAEAYAWGWQEYQRIWAQMRELAEQILPGADPVAAMRHLDTAGAAVEGVEQVQQWLQQMMDTAIAKLDGTHFDIAEPIKTVEARIAPPGSAAAPYYSRPSLDFSRPGRTWLPTLGRTRFPLYNLISTWYHEGVPGHHLQLAQWTYQAPELSVFQTTIGSSSGITEGWALYAERLADELGFLDTEARIGYLDGQLFRAMRVIVDIGMHLQLPIPDDSPIAPGQTWTPELAVEFFRAHSGEPEEYIDSEIIRYLGWPGQAISYKLGERAWLAGRAAARRAHAERGEDFDLKRWHRDALSLGAVRLDELTDTLAEL